MRSTGFEKRKKKPVFFNRTDVISVVFDYVKNAFCKMVFQQLPKLTTFIDIRILIMFYNVLLRHLMFNTSLPKHYFGHGYFRIILHWVCDTCTFLLFDKVSTPTA